MHSSHYATLRQKIPTCLQQVYLKLYKQPNHPTTTTTTTTHQHQQYHFFGGLASSHTQPPQHQQHYLGVSPYPTNPSTHTSLTTRTIFLGSGHTRRATRRLLFGVSSAFHKPQEHWCLKEQSHTIVWNRALSLWWREDDDESETKNKQYNDRRLLLFPPDTVYNVVADVGSYSEWLPWCVSSKVLARRGTDTIIAELEVGFKQLKESYESTVTLVPYSSVMASSSSKIFHVLINKWTFEPGPTSDTCWTSFFVEFKFRSQLHALAADLFFTEVKKQMITAIEERCKLLNTQTEDNKHIP